MKLFLMQHALAFSKEENPERPLTIEGIEQAKKSALGIRHLDLAFDLIIASPKRRAKQTAALIAESVRYPYSDIMYTDSLLPDQTPDTFIDLLKKERSESHILVVGHLPHLANLVQSLTHCEEFHFHHAGITCLNMSGPKSATLEYHLNADHLARF